VATVEESVLRTEMAGLESQEEDAPHQKKIDSINIKIISSK
jgi:hypothetical protein